MDDGSSGVMAFLIVLCAIGLIPAFIASSKGRNFALWWLYGAGLFIVALIHAVALKSQDDETIARVNSVAASADALAKFAQLKKDGLISEAEFDAKKKQLLGAAVPSSTEY